jgi:hypothetical protein
VPPQSAFNNKKVVIPDAKRVLALNDLDDLQSLSGRQFQRGQGGYTLCERCNNETGHLYGQAYADWAHQGARILRYALGGSISTELAYPFDILPARVLKQIACMFFSINPPKFQARHPDLVRFVLNRDAKYFPRPLKLFVGYIRSPIARRSSVSAALNMQRGETRFLSELTFYPFAYILSLDGRVPEYRMLDITWFSHSSYEEPQSLHLPIPSLDAYTPFPGDFRSRDQVLRESGA